MLAYLLQLLALLILVFLLVLYYSQPQVSLYVRGLVFLSWSLSFVIILILPLDIHEAAETSAVKTIWIAIYYVNFVLTWLVLPIAQEYEGAGEFTVRGRLRRSLYNNLLLILIFSTLAAGLIIYLIASSQMSWSKIPSILATTANLFGILLVIVFLGHGLVSLPKQSLLLSNYKKLINYQYRQAELIDIRRYDTAFDIEVEYRKVKAIKDMTSNALYQKHCETILELVPEEVVRQVGKDPKAFEREEVLREVDEGVLAATHRVVKRKVSELGMYTTWMDGIVQRVEECNRSVVGNQYKYKKLGYLAVFGLTTTLSLLVFLAQLSTFVPAVTIVNLPYQINTIPIPWLVYLLNTSFLLYIVYMISRSIFQMKIFGLYSLHPHHSTSASLLFTSVNISRVSYPICYNYLQMTGLPKTAFLSFFGEISMGDRNVYVFPILLLAFALFNVVDLYDRIMTCFGLGNYGFNQDEKEESRREGKRVVEEWARAKGNVVGVKGTAGSMQLAGKGDEGYMELAGI